MPSWRSKSVSESVDGASMSLQTALVPELAASSDGAAVGTAEQIRPPVRLLTSVAMLLALSVAGGVGAVGRSMSLACTTPCMKALGYQGCLGWVPTLGCVHVVFAVPLAAIATSQLTVELGRLRSRGGLLATGAGPAPPSARPAAAAAGGAGAVFRAASLFLCLSLSLSLSV